MPSPSVPSLPAARQAQIIRAHQRDLYHVASLREQAEGVVRSWLGTRWLTRWDKEVEFVVKALYYGMTSGRAIQTLGEEYTDIWARSASNNKLPSPLIRAALVLVPTLPSYVLSRWSSNLNAVQRRSPALATYLRSLPFYLEMATEVNLAIFYLRGTYYDLSKRVLGVRHLSSIPENPNARPPSYSLLGILIAARLIYRLISHLRSKTEARQRTAEGKMAIDDRKATFVDGQLVSAMLNAPDPESQPAKPAEEDVNTVLDIASVPSGIRAGRSCTLCLEERTDSCATECGHLFCWSCIVGWGREKAECPLCRQSLTLTRLLPIYNL
ncbi:hypothetical protein CONPUDRAFT_114617 [Coniophora puteana RWD-64-598 SS2]|uniref:RING-type E3 ubiquitin transferase n=1 Tax=Coniophora puteana (strain RWD-64-598) TaxID=741705 RepID=A0A5M3N4Z8_CONPW|nr:uncharacterized protein CONPUDRAFT_114617 [Coniophora puteana RWD-64-598 SS2]EIW86376.1 hypothetical protein CONPUDRAFT_114617 [Coniophora puteana RWD-64-598 SS2]